LLPVECAFPGAAPIEGMRSLPKPEERTFGEKMDVGASGIEANLLLCFSIIKHGNA
jgi:hypothetical protein